MKAQFWVFAACVVVASLLDLVVALRGDGERVSEEAMKAALQEIRSRTKPGDVLVHSPLLSLAELAALEDLSIRPDVPSKAVQSSRRVLVLDRTDYSMFGFGEPSERIPLLEGLELEIYTPTGSADVPVFDLSSALLPSTLRIERPGSRALGPGASPSSSPSPSPSSSPGNVVTHCNVSRPEGGFGCPGEADWLYAATVNHLVIDGHQIPCVWAHPTTGGVLVFVIPELPAPPPERRLELRFQGALTDDAVRNTPDGAVVSTEIVQGTAAIGRVTVPNAIGWVRGTFSIRPNERVELRVTSPRDGRRHFCINASVMDVGGPAP